MSDNTELAEFKDVIQKVNSICLVEAVGESQIGTPDQRYSALLDFVIADVLKVSVMQIENGSSPVDSSVLVASTFSKAAKIMGVTYGKSHSIVAADIIDTLENFPTEDYRRAILLRKQNNLH